MATGGAEVGLEVTEVRVFGSVDRIIELPVLRTTAIVMAGVLEDVVRTSLRDAVDEAAATLAAGVDVAGKDRDGTAVRVVGLAVAVVHPASTIAARTNEHTS